MDLIYRTSNDTWLMNVKNAIENYLTIFSSNQEEERGIVLKLIQSLDELAVVTNNFKYTFYEHDSLEPPE